MRTFLEFFFRFVTLTLDIPDKMKLHPWGNDFQAKDRSQDPWPMEIPHFFLITTRNSTSYFYWLLKFPYSVFFSTPGNSALLHFRTPPPRVRVRATVKLSAVFFSDESSITIGGAGGGVGGRVRKCNSVGNSTSSAQLLSTHLLCSFVLFFLGW